MQVIEKAYAKVNISLNLTGQKEHNLHYLVSMICFSDFYDTIVIEDSNEFKYVINDDVKFNKPDLILKTIEFLSKEIGKDFYEGKVTLPIILLFQKANIEEKKILKDIQIYFPTLKLI